MNTISHTNIEWCKVSESNLPENRQRIMFYRPNSLTKIGEMTFFEADKQNFLDSVSHYALQVEHPDQKEIEEWKEKHNAENVF